MGVAVYDYFKKKKTAVIFVGVTPYPHRARYNRNSCKYPPLNEKPDKSNEKHTEGKISR